MLNDAMIHATNNPFLCSFWNTWIAQLSRALFLSSDAADSILIRLHGKKNEILLSMIILSKALRKRLCYNPGI